MDMLQKHGFYVGLLAVLGVYIVAYLVLIAPMQKTITRETNNLKSLVGKMQGYADKPSLPNEAVVRYHEEQKQRINETLQKVLDFYSKRDQAIEKWFPEIDEKLPKGSVKVPELDFFQAVYAKHRQELLNKYADNKCPLRIAKRSGFAAFELSQQERAQEIQDILQLMLPNKIVTESDMKKLQKQFTLMQGLLEILEAGKLKNLTIFRFSKSREAEEISFVIHNVEVTGAMEYSDIPTLTQEILNNKKEFMVEIASLNIQRDRQYRPKETKIYLKLGESEAEGLERWKKENAGKEDTPLVFVHFICRILDYEEKKPVTEENAG
jgi:hypothetical protein